MGSTLVLANIFLREYVTDGVPSSGINYPAKSDGVATFADADSRLGILEAAVGVSGGVFAGIIQNVDTIWSGDYPGTGNAGLYSTQSYSGAPTGSGFAYSGGNGGLPLNLSFITSDELDWTGAGGAQGWMFKYAYGGGSAAGDRIGLVVDMDQTGAMASGSNDFNSLAVFSGAFANVAGAASGAGNGKGSDFALWLNFGRLQSDIWRLEVVGSEYDFSPSAGSSADYAEFGKFVNYAPSGWTPNIFGAFFTFSTENGALMPHCLTFGDPQSTDNGFPVTSTGDLLYAFAGTCGTAIDFSNLTCTDLIKGPNGFSVDGSAKVSASGLQVSSATGLIGVRDTSDTGGGFVGDSFATLQLGMYNPSGGVWNAVAAGDYMSMFGMNSSGQVGTLESTLLGNSPTFRNTIDDGSGNASFAGSMALGGTVKMTGLPTSNPHVVGELWNNSGAVAVSAG